MKVTDTNTTVTKYSIREKANIFLYYIDMRNARFGAFPFTMFSTGKNVNELYRYCVRDFSWIWDYEYFEINPSYDSNSIRGYYDKS